MASAKFKELERRLAKLRRRFLPKKPAATGNYTEMQLDRARGYRLLAHAEIEAFLEDICKDTANTSLNEFRAGGRPKLVLLNILAFHLVQEKLSDPAIKAIFANKTDHCEAATTSANTHYNKMLAQNHGVKEENLLRMLLPIGLHPVHIDPAWVSTLDAFGADRGKVAHTSIKTQQQINPMDELKTVEDILVGLQKLDGLIGKLR